MEAKLTTVDAEEAHTKETVVEDSKIGVVVEAAARLTTLIDLPPLLALPATDELLQRVRAQWMALRTSDGIHRLLGEDVSSWHARNEELVKQIIDGNRRTPKKVEQSSTSRSRQQQQEEADEALLELVARDPRYLTSELVLGKILLARLEIAYGDRRVPAYRQEDLDAPEAGSIAASQPGAQARHRQQAPSKARATRAERAATFLERLGERVDTRRGNGPGAFTDPVELLRRHRQNEKAVAEIGRVATAMRNDEVAARVDLPEEWVAKLREPPLNKATARVQTLQITAWDFGLKPDTIRRLLPEAEAIDVYDDGGWVEKMPRRKAKPKVRKLPNPQLVFKFGDE